MEYFTSNNEPIRPTIVDGIFYPNRGEELHRVIKEFFETINTQPGNAFAILTPHAAFEYSGKLLAQAFKSTIYRDIKTVIILGPMHRDPIEGMAVPTASYFETPEGNLRVNKEYIEKLMNNCKNVIYDDISHFEEHSIEVTLPFIHYLFPSADIVPILLGNQSIKTIKENSKAFNLTFKNDFKYILFVISSNMSSYLTGRQPREEAKRLINLTMEKDWKGIINSSEKGLISGCGANAISTLLAIDDLSEELNLKPVLLGEDNSSSIDSDENKIVNYAAIAFFPQSFSV